MLPETKAISLANSSCSPARISAFVVNCLRTYLYFNYQYHEIQSIAHLFNADAVSQNLLPAPSVETLANSLHHK